MIFSPPLVKGLVKYLTGSKENPNLTASSILVEEQHEIRNVSCRANNHSSANIELNCLGCDLVCMHHKFSSPFCKFAIQHLTILYAKLIDHDVLSGKFGDITLTDMTGYPNTINPGNFKLQPGEDLHDPKFCFCKLSCFKSPIDKPTFEMFRFNSDCPEKPTEINNTTSKFVLRFDELWANLINELLLKRNLSYLLDQVIYSLYAQEEYILFQYFL